jgi:ribosomal protein L31
MGTTYTVARPDVLTGASGQQNGFVSSWGTSVCLAPKAGNQLSVASHRQTVYSNVGSAYVADPSGVVEKYNKRFNEHTYYTA